jgi:predicted secreted Zn-dependent protease
MATTPPTGRSRARWRTSSYSANGGNCVQVAATPLLIAVRDSRHRHGPQLAFTPTAWQAFITAVKTRETGAP